MANSLTQRLCHTDPDQTRHLAWDIFGGSLIDILHGTHTIAQVKSHFNMTPTDEAAFDTLVGLLNTPQLVDRVVRYQRFRSIMGKWEYHDDPDNQILTYMTDDEIEAHLLAIDTGP